MVNIQGAGLSRRRSREPGFGRPRVKVGSPRASARSRPSFGRFRRCGAQGGESTVLPPRRICAVFVPGAMLVPEQVFVLLWSDFPDGRQQRDKPSQAQECYNSLLLPGGYPERLVEGARALGFEHAAMPPRRSAMSWSLAQPPKLAQKSLLALLVPIANWLYNPSGKTPMRCQIELHASPISTTPGLFQPSLATVAPTLGPVAAEIGQHRPKLGRGIGIGPEVRSGGRPDRDRILSVTPAAFDMAEPRDNDPSLPDRSRAISPAPEGPESHRPPRCARTK